ncbi:MAG: hypothetical protein R3C97_00460 [Geminicoccaceae bacterium]
MTRLAPRYAVGPKAGGRGLAPGGRATRMPRDPERTLMQPCLVDAHVHLYDRFEPHAILAAAAENAARLAGEFGLDAATPAFLLLTLTARERPLDRFFAKAPAPWTKTRLDEIGTLRFSATGKPDVHIVPGSQVVSREGLEVLALATGERPAEGRPAKETLDEVRAAGGIAVLPWGIGKWTGRRAAVVRELIEGGDPAAFFLGDIAGRLGMWPRPALLGEAEARGYRVLPGTDPLDFAGEERSIARLGFRATFDPADPAASLKAGLHALTASPRAGGRNETPWRFVRHQFALQIRKRFGQGRKPSG